MLNSVEIIQRKKKKEKRKKKKEKRKKKKESNGKHWKIWLPNWIVTKYLDLHEPHVDT